jgi:glycosyltransferase involved in cell wall biosynthesis
MLSVIIPTRNRARLLRSALQSLLKQTLPADEFEVLVVDNGSSDDTREVVDGLLGQPCEVRYLFDPTPGLHVGRHLGLKEARGDVLVYADDDIEATPTWLEAIRDCFRVPGVALVGGNNYPKFEGPPPSWLQKLWQVPSFGGQAITSLSVLELPAGQRPLSPYLVWGCNFSIRKQVLLDAGGFHPDGMPEEEIRFRGDGETHVSAHVAKTGLMCLFDSRASVYHAVPNTRMSFDYFRKRSFNQGISESYTRLRNREISAAAHESLLEAAVSAVRNLCKRARDLLPRDRELRMLDRCVRDGYREGYNYHQRIYREDPAVRAWVHQPDYY